MVIQCGVDPVKRGFTIKTKVRKENYQVNWMSLVGFTTCVWGCVRVCVCVCLYILRHYKKEIKSRFTFEKKPDVTECTILITEGKVEVRELEMSDTRSVLPEKQ